MHTSLLCNSLNESIPMQWEMIDLLAANLPTPNSIPMLRYSLQARSALRGVRFSSSHSAPKPGS